MMKRFLRLAAALVLGFPLLVKAEVNFSKEDFNKLDAFEAHSLQKADKVFASKQYRQAAAEYDAFILEFPRSPAVAYALLRKARCQHLDGKRFNAIKIYNEVLDYFPDSVRYAAAALYHLGLAQSENGEEEKAMKAWAEMADDADYRRHYLAASAINKLAAYLGQKGRQDEAIRYYRQVAADFRTSNADAANEAIGKVVVFYVRTKKNEAELRKFFKETAAFDNRPRKLEKEPQDDPYYWDTVRRLVSQHGNFNDIQLVERKAYYQYWADVMDGRFAGWDDYQINLADFRLKHDGDQANWMQRLDRQFADHQKDGDMDRVVKWVSLYHGHAGKAAEYYQKLDFAKMKNKQIQDLMQVCFDQLRDAKMARNVYEKLKFEEFDDPQKVQILRYLWHRDEGLVLDLSMRMKNKEFGKLELLRYYHWRRNGGKGIPLAADIENVPDYAKEVLWKKAELLEWSKRYADAITAYRASDNPPDNLFRMADCLAAMGSLEKAVAQLAEVENFFTARGSEAALKIAYLYRDSGDRVRYVSSLRRIMKKYPESKQSAAAHEELEKLGERIGGGVDAQ